MLYISRIYPADNSASLYGVVDTDDDVETLVTYSELNEATGLMNLHIEGVELDEYVSEIIPYQDKRYYSNKQLRAKMLLGVDIRTYKDEVSAILLDNRILKDNTKIVLSEFGKRISGVAEIGFTSMRGPHNKLIIVLDDKIEIYGDALRIFISGVYWDVSQMPDNFVRMMYEYLVMHHVDHKYWRQFLIDSKGRYMLNRG